MVNEHHQFPKMKEAGRVFGGREQGDMLSGRQPSRRGGHQVVCQRGKYFHGMRVPVTVKLDLSLVDQLFVRFLIQILFKCVFYELHFSI